MTMKKMVKKVLACALAAVLTVGAASSAMAATSSPTTSTKPVAKPNVTTTNGSKVDTKKDGTATMNKIPAAQAKKKQVTVSSTVTVNGVKYKVTTVDARAFLKATKATTITLPATITKINKNAFTGAKKLKTLKFKSKKVASMTIQKGAFKGLSTKKMTIRVSKSLTKKQYNRLVKKLKAAGFKGKVKKNLA